ncbi:MAG: deoxyribodipyrimidine photo-lyase [Kofleriaceae bacterium]
MRTIVWFRGKDLRVKDHAPLRDAVANGDVIPLFVLDPYFFAPERARELPHRIQFLLDSLHELSQSIARLGSRLIVVAGKSIDVVPRLAKAWRADRVVAHRWTEPFGRERDRRIDEALGGALVLYEGETLLPPGTLRTGGGTPYAVFTPFSRAAKAAASIAQPLAAPRRLPGIPHDVRARKVAIPTTAELGIPRNDAILVGGETAAGQRLRRFVRGVARTYDKTRDRMDLAGTSRLSADLKFGTVSVRAVWASVATVGGRGSSTFHNELLWREFAYHTLWDRPDVLERPFRDDFIGFPWRTGHSEWAAWVAGTTGYPIVDASARQLLGEGFVHNRARMISASFLTKHLLIEYRRGEAHYMKFLSDGDWANNNLGWQWSAGCGCDAQPYFRIFNPVTQGERFDPSGDYVRRWVPELARLPARLIHQPWTAPDDVLRAAGVELGKTYPRPIVDHQLARERFLAMAASHLRGRAPRGQRLPASS